MPKGLNQCETKKNTKSKNAAYLTGDLSSMGGLMPVAQLLVDKLLATNATLEWFLIAMDLLMRPQITQLEENLAADLALLQVLSGVDPHMYF